MVLTEYMDEADELMAKCQDATLKKSKRDEVIGLAYASRYASEPIPKYVLSKYPSSPRVAYQMVHDLTELDGKPTKNMASFVTTFMEKEAHALIMENLNKNFADFDEYPATQIIHERCIAIIGNLWKASQDEHCIGTATAGSSEGVMLGGLAMKFKWRSKRLSQGKDASKPNIVFGCNAQVALEKFARYFDVEPRMVPVTDASRYCMDPDEAIKYVDENTIGGRSLADEYEHSGYSTNSPITVFVILGSTYTGHFENVELMAKLLDDFEKRTKCNVPIHIDAASGGFFAPFIFPKHKWAFDIPRVKSINSSGHKYGLTYPGVGWVLWRCQTCLPKELIFELNYLGGTEKTFTINFSRPSCFILAQYYNFLRLGML